MAWLAVEHNGRRVASPVGHEAPGGGGNDHTQRYLAQDLNLRWFRHIMKLLCGCAFCTVQIHRLWNWRSRYQAHPPRPFAAPTSSQGNCFTRNGITSSLHWLCCRKVWQENFAAVFLKHIHSCLLLIKKTHAVNQSDIVWYLRDIRLPFGGSSLTYANSVWQVRF